MKSYKILINKYEGQNIEAGFILAAGPSLYENMQNPIFSKLSEYGIVVVVNSAIMAYPEPSFFISCDHLVTHWTWWEDFVKKSKCVKIVRSSWLKYKDEIKDFYIFEPRKTPECEINPEDQGLCYPNSLSAAIDFTIKFLGEKGKVFVLGLDHHLSKDKYSYHHFWQYFKNKPKQLKPAQGSWNQQKSVFSIHLQAYKALNKFAEYKNCKIYNCNPESGVSAFEKINFDQIFKILKK